MLARRTPSTRASACCVIGNSSLSDRSRAIKIQRARRCVRLWQRLQLLSLTRLQKDRHQLTEQKPTKGAYFIQSSSEHFRLNAESTAGDLDDVSVKWRFSTDEEWKPHHPLTPNEPNPNRLCLISLGHNRHQTILNKVKMLDRDSGVLQNTPRLKRNKLKRWIELVKVVAWQRSKQHVPWARHFPIQVGISVAEPAQQLVMYGRVRFQSPPRNVHGWEEVLFSPPRPTKNGPGAGESPRPVTWIRRA